MFQAMIEVLRGQIISVEQSQGFDIEWAGAYGISEAEKLLKRDFDFPLCAALGDPIDDVTVKLMIVESGFAARDEVLTVRGGEVRRQTDNVFASVNVLASRLSFFFEATFTGKVIIDLTPDLPPPSKSDLQSALL